MPQTLSDAWIRDLGPDAKIIHAECLHWPGNLTLSGYNQELWNHPKLSAICRATSLLPAS
jgi:hypothetical protein